MFLYFSLKNFIAIYSPISTKEGSGSKGSGEIEPEQSQLDDEEVVEKVDPKSTLRWREPFAFRTIPATKKEMDFPEVEKERVRKKILKKKQDEKLDSAANKFAGRTYDLIYNACADLMYGRRYTRMAFGQWLAVVGMESTVQMVLPLGRLG